MISMTLAQWCEEERLEVPTYWTDLQPNPPDPVFAIKDTRGDFAEISFLAPTSPTLVIGHTQRDAANIDNSIAQ
jgi:hypothetical protein